MKKTIIIIGLIIVAGSFCYLFYFRGVNKNEVNAVVNTSDNSSKQEEIILSEFSQEELESYYAIYEDPYVKYLRVALDEYSSGKITTVDEFAIKKYTSDDSEIYGLDSFNANYYKSRFLVLSINDYVFGGKIIDVIFTDIQDRVFVAWVYPAGKSEDHLQLRGFWQNSNFDSDKMEKIKIQYKEFLSDKEHSI